MLPTTSYGSIISIKGFIVDVEFISKDRPQIYDVLCLYNDPSVKLFVNSVVNSHTFKCLMLSDPSSFFVGAKVVNTFEPLSVYLDSKSLLGTVMDMSRFISILNTSTHDLILPIFKTNVKSEDIVLNKTVIETGIKLIDLFCPIVIGSKVGIFGGAGVGKSMILKEIMHNVASKTSTPHVSVFAGIGERTREAHELCEEIDTLGILNSVFMVFGMMGSSYVSRYLSGWVAASVAEYLRDVQSKNIMFFTDNMFRFIQADNEISMLSSNLPSEDGYQPDLLHKLATLQERLVSTKHGSITSMQAVYVPADDLLDYAVTSISNVLDVSIVLSRNAYKDGLLPAVDILSSESKFLDPNIVGESHYVVVKEAKSMLSKAASLERIVSLIGESELSDTDRTVYRRAKKIKNFMTQDFFVANGQTHKIGKFVSLANSIAGLSAIIDGKLDTISEEKFLYIGSISDVQ